MKVKDKQPSFLEEGAGVAPKEKRARGKSSAKLSEGVSEGVSEPRVTTEPERVPTTSERGGGPGGGGVPREGEEEPEGKDGGKEGLRETTSGERTEGARDARKKTGEGSRKRGGAERAAKLTKAEPVYVRLSGAMLQAIEKAVEGSPIEFADRSEFIRRSVENELRRRGLVGTYK